MTGIELLTACLLVFAVAFLVLKLGVRCLYLRTLFCLNMLALLHCCYTKGPLGYGHAYLRGGYLNPRYMPKLFDKIIVQAGLPDIRFHDLRHSAATLLISMGISVKVVQEILGHSEISMTLGTYGHVLPVMHKEVTDKWDEKFKLLDKDDRESR